MPIESGLAPKPAQQAFRKEIEADLVSSRAHTPRRLFMNDASNVYGGFEECLGFIGSSETDATEALCANRTLPEISEIAQLLKPNATR